MEAVVRAEAADALRGGGGEARPRGPAAQGLLVRNLLVITTSADAKLQSPFSAPVAQHQLSCSYYDQRWLQSPFSAPVA